jgi:drug/metabolite transporter (DMT)-like permease
MSIGSDIVIDLSSWIDVLVVSRTANAIVSVAILAIALTAFRGLARPLIIGSSGEAGSIDRRVVVLVLLAGILDVAGLIVFTYGLEFAETWLVGLASSVGPTVTIVVAVAFLGERLRPIQWLGLAGVLIGMIAIGLPS